MTFEEMKNLPEEEQKKLFHSITEKRYLAKRVNFSCVYGAGPPKIAETTGMSLKEAEVLHTAYWKRNKSVKQVSANVITKNVDGSIWLYNPVSTFWYPLRYEKDIFSGLNQSTGVYCFDRYLMEVRKRGVKISFQYHDEWMAIFSRNEFTEDDIRNIIDESIRIVNSNLNLNVPLGSSADFGLNYSQIH